MDSQVAHITQRTDVFFTLKKEAISCSMCVYLSIYISIYMYMIWKHHKDMLTSKRYEFYTKVRKV